MKIESQNDQINEGRKTLNDFYRYSIELVLLLEWVWPDPTSPSVPGWAWI